MLPKQVAIALTFLLVFDLPSAGTLLAQNPVATDDSKFVVVGYLPEYRLDSIDPQRLVGVTDLVYFGIEPPTNGEFPGTISARQLEKLAEIKQLIGCRLLLTVGGWERSSGFVRLTESSEAQTKFINELSKFCQANGFDGVDYDWEHPKGSAEIQCYENLISETKAVLSPHGLMVTVALASWQDLGKATYDSADRIHLMSYDHEFPQATMGKTRDDVRKLLGRGCPANKIAVGIPFYGRNKTGQAKTYAELIGIGLASAETIEGYALNSKLTVVSKIEFAQQQQLAGIMIWELGQDAAEPQHSLLKLIVDSLAR